MPWMRSEADGEPGPVSGAAGLVIGALASWRAARPGMLVVAIDGHGAAGKSTIADAVAGAIGAALVHTDDFFLGQPGGDPPRLERYYDWRRLRAEALEPLRAGHGAAFRRFDWERGPGRGGQVTVRPSEVILVEGVLSAAPELADLVDRSVFVDTPRPERLRRLRRLVAPEDWDADWLIAEQAYFDGARPPSSFDLVVPGTGPAARPVPRLYDKRKPHGSSGRPG
jgi:uridine kinase